MGKVRLITDSVSDIFAADEKLYDIRIVPIMVEIGNKPYVSRVDFDNEEFYRLMNQYDEIPKTSQITPYNFQEIYLEEAKNGATDLILVLLNAAGSGTHGNALMAKNLFFEEYPEYEGKIRIDVYDGIGYSGHYGYPVVVAGRMLKEGKSADEVRSYLEEILPKRRLYFGMYTLKYAGKSGRIPSAAAFLGDKLNLKPIMRIADNTISTAAKVRGEARMIDKIVKMTLEDMIPGSPYQIIYGSDVKCAEELKSIMIEKTGYEPDGYYQIGAAIAANAGPKVAGLAFTAK